MAMFLDNVPIFLITLSVRWSSDAVLKYIINQVMEFSKLISSIIINNDLSHNLPDMRISLFDPITLTHKLLFWKLIGSNGRCIKDEIINALVFFVTLLSPMIYFNSGAKKIYRWYYLGFHLFSQHLIVLLFWLLFSLIDFRIMSVLCSNSSLLLGTK